MIDRKKKYQIQTDSPYPHMGRMLKMYITDNKINRTSLAAKMGVSYVMLQNYFNQESLQMGIIWKLSLATGYNFIAEIAENMSLTYIQEEEMALLQSINESEKEIADLEQEL